MPLDDLEEELRVDRTAPEDLVLRVDLTDLLEEEGLEFLIVLVLVVDVDLDGLVVLTFLVGLVVLTDPLEDLVFLIVLV